MGNVPRGRQPTQRPLWKKDRRAIRASLVCQASTTVPGASQSGSVHELRRPGETTMKEIQAVLGVPACPAPQDCPARGEKRVHLA